MSSTEAIPIEVGQIYLAADGSRCGHLVIAIDHDKNDAITIPFSDTKIERYTRRIDIFKLTCVRYYRVNKPPKWYPTREEA